AAHLRDVGSVLYSPARAAHPLEAPLERFQSRQNETLSRSSPRFHRDSVHCDIGREKVANGNASRLVAPSQTGTEPNLTAAVWRIMKLEEGFMISQSFASALVMIALGTGVAAALKGKRHGHPTHTF